MKNCHFEIKVFCEFLIYLDSAWEMNIQKYMCTLINLELK